MTLLLKCSSQTPVTFFMVNVYFSCVLKHSRWCQAENTHTHTHSTHSLTHTYTCKHTHTHTHTHTRKCLALELSKDFPIVNSKMWFLSLSWNRPWVFRVSWGACLAVCWAVTARSRSGSRDGMLSGKLTLSFWRVGGLWRYTFAPSPYKQGML